MSIRKYSKQEKEKYVEEFKNSNESQTAFAKTRGIPEATFRGWLNYQNDNDNDITFGRIDLNTINDIEFAFKYHNISIELKKGFDKKVLKRVLGVFMNA